MAEESKTFQVVYDYSDVPTLKRFALDNSRVRMALGCFGCLRGDQLVITSEGLIPISLVTPQMLVLSWSEKPKEFVFVSGSGAFPKGKDYLYRIVTPQGEFVAKDSHRILSSLGIYLRVDQLKVGDEVASVSPNLLSTIFSSSQSRKLSGDLRSYCKDEGSPEHYANEDHRYDQRLPLAEDNDRSFSPSRGDAQ